jgi:hypothetical protein
MHEHTAPSKLNLSTARCPRCNTTEDRDLTVNGRCFDAYACQRRRNRDVPTERELPASEEVR